MARAAKVKSTLESVFFATPEQKLVRFLLTESTTTFTLRELSSKLKGVRGLGGAEGMLRILKDLELLGLVQFVNNGRSVCLNNESQAISMLKAFAALCDLEGLREQVEPLSSKGILFGSRANGRARTDSDYDLFVVSAKPVEVRNIIEHHPLGRKIELVTWSPDEYHLIERRDPDLNKKLGLGLVVWGNTW